MRGRLALAGIACLTATSLCAQSPPPAGARMPWESLRAQLAAIDPTAAPYRATGTLVPCEYGCTFLTPMARAAEVVRTAQARHRELREDEVRAILASDEVHVLCSVECATEAQTLGNWVLLQSAREGVYFYVQPLTCEQDTVGSWRPRTDAALFPPMTLPDHFVSGLRATFRMSEVPRTPPLFIVFVRSMGGEARLHLEAEQLR